MYAYYCKPSCNNLTTGTSRMDARIPVWAYGASCAGLTHREHQCIHTPRCSCMRSYISHVPQASSQAGMVPPARRATTLRLRARAASEDMPTNRHRAVADVPVLWRCNSTYRYYYLLLPEAQGHSRRPAPCAQSFPGHQLVSKAKNIPHAVHIYRYVVHRNCYVQVYT